jgi:kinesin family protein 6/9
VKPDEGEYDATMGPNNRDSNFKFKFHQVLHNSSQETVYDTIGREVVQGVVDGTNGTIMSYGQTGSGKTFTMVGDTSNYPHRGVAPRALSHIFQEVNLRMETEYVVRCTYMEIYNEKIFDLLADLSSAEARTEFTIGEEKGGRGVHVRGLTEVAVKSEEEALNLLFSGELGRTTAQHKLNRRSNRSHSIFTVYVQQRSRSGVSEKTLCSKLSIVDLAGSERLKKTMEGGRGGAEVEIDDTLKKESMCINQSLTYLEQCVVALSRKGANTAHVPYRQTKLTNVLKDALGGNCNTLLCACIWGESAHLEETISTLRLASRMMRVQNSTMAVEVTDPVKLVKKQEQTIKELKQELLMHDALADRTGVVYDPYTPEQVAGLKKQLEKYLTCAPNEEEDALEFRSVRQMREVCKLFKSMFKQQAEYTQRLATGAASGAMTGGLGATTAAEAMAMSLGGADATGFLGSTEGMVGKEAGVGFGLGTAADGARPMSQDLGSMRGYKEGGDGASTVGSPGGYGSPVAEAKDSGSPERSTMGGAGYKGAGSGLQDRDTAYLVYKSGAGKMTNRRLNDAKARLKQEKSRVKACAAAINESKRTIDDLTAQIDEKKAARAQQRKFSGMEEGEQDDIVDEEEFRLMKRQREAKKQYRAAYEELTGLRAGLEAASKEVDSLKFQLLSDFEEWFKGAGVDDPFGNTGGGGDEKEVLDDQEAFEQMEIERITAQDPDSLAFFQAQKTKRANMTQNHVALKQLHKNKRNL